MYRFLRKEVEIIPRQSQSATVQHFVSGGELLQLNSPVLHKLTIYLAIKGSFFSVFNILLLIIRKGGAGNRISVFQNSEGHTQAFQRLATVFIKCCVSTV